MTTFPATLRTRKTALQILSQVSEQRFSTELLRAAAKEKDIHYGLLQRLVKGPLQWKERLDAELTQAFGRSFQALSEHDRWALRVALYQLTMLKRVPKNLVIQETEAVLRPEHRRLARSLFDLKLPKAPAADSVDTVALAYSHPDWIVERWVRRLGLEQTKELCEADNRPWPVMARTNTLQLNRSDLMHVLRDEGLVVGPGRFSKDAVRFEKLPRGKRLTSLDSFRNGLFQVQDESAQLVIALLAPQPGEFVLDLCAAPGGKAMHCATLMRNKGRIVAVDESSGRLRMVKENCRRQKIKIIETVAADGRTFSLGEKLADRVLVDAPCSGTGVMGRKSDIRWMRGAESLAELSSLQFAILTRAATLVGVGGRLVYSTCSLLHEENQAIVEQFLRSHKNFELLARPEGMNRSLFTEEGYLETWPHRHKIAGAFAAAFTRLF